MCTGQPTGSPQTSSAASQSYEPTFPATVADPHDFSNKYNTKLTPEEEAQYQKWAKETGKEKDVYDYDLRGFWKDQATFADNGHGSDKYKKPNHPTFSDQSQYHGVDGYEGGKWSESKKGVSYTPGKTNMLAIDQLKDYFKKYEPGVKLQIK